MKTQVTTIVKVTFQLHFLLNLFLILLNFLPIKAPSFKYLPLAFVSSHHSSKLFRSASIIALIFTIFHFLNEEVRTSKIEELSIKKDATVAGQFLTKLFQIIFYVQLILISILVIGLAVRGFIYAARNTDRFHPKKWYPPLLGSTASAGVVSFMWQWISFHNPSKAIKAAFWVGPLLTCAAGILHVLIGYPVSLAAGTIAVVSSVIQSLYACWVSPRFNYTTKILTVSTYLPPEKTSTFVTLSLLTCLLYSSFLLIGIGGATATRTGLDIVFIILILLTWEMFKRAELISLIDSDLTGAFCFFSGVAVGSICTLVGGTWALAIHKSYATEVSIYAFLIGYFMCSITLTWQQACVSAYYVAYAENPQGLRFDETIPVRIQEGEAYNFGEPIWF